MQTSDSTEPFITIASLAEKLGLQFEGDGDLQINSVSSLSSATKNDLCFIRSRKYVKSLNQSHCGAAIVPLGFNDAVENISLIYSANPDLSFVKVINLLQLYKGDTFSENIHPTAIISASARLGENVIVGAKSVIGDNVSIGDNVRIGASCVIESGVKLGCNSMLYSNVTLCFDVEIGENAIFQPGVVIGGDGFGLVYDEGNWVKIPHLGTVKIADRVEIGANTTVDRGALDDTILEHGVKIDNQIQVGHNVKIGENTAIAACVGIAGSTVIGKNCQISGAVSISGHLTITDNVTITIMSVVTKDITESGTFSSGTPLMENRLWHRNNVRYKSLDKLAKSVSGIEKTLK